MNIWLSYVSYWVLKDNNSFSPYIFCQYLANCIVMVWSSLARSTNVSLSCVVMKLMGPLLHRSSTAPPARYNICYLQLFRMVVAAPSYHRTVISEMIKSPLAIQLFFMPMHHWWLPWQSTKLKALFGLTRQQSLLQISFQLEQVQTCTTLVAIVAMVAMVI